MSAYASLVSIANEAQLGGNAVIAYGYPRQTNDFDLLVCTRHRYQWDALIRELGYFPKNYHAVFHNYKSELPEQYPIDLMLVDAPTFEKFEAGAMLAVGGTHASAHPSAAASAFAEIALGTLVR